MTDWTTTGMLKVCGAIFVALTAVFLPFPEIDMHVAAIFYNGDNDFWLRKSLYTAWSNAYIRPLVGVLAVVGLAVYLFIRLTGRVRQVKEMARYGFFILSIFLATGLVVHAVLKDNWGRARPKHVVEFDGSKIFTPPLLPADQCERNCSFVSGDASLGFAFLALALYATRRRNFWIVMSIGAGLGLGALRMMNGSHFLSDILYAGVFTCGPILLMYRWMIEGRWAADTAGPVRLGRTVLDWASTPETRAGLARARVRFRRFGRKIRRLLLPDAADGARNTGCEDK